MSGLSPQSDPKRISLGPGFDKSLDVRESGSSSPRTFRPLWLRRPSRRLVDRRRRVEKPRLDLGADAREEPGGDGPAGEAAVDLLKEVGAAARRDRLGVPPENLDQFLVQRRHGGVLIAQKRSGLL
jgi:hypothetical protein